MGILSGETESIPDGSRNKWALPIDWPRASPEERWSIDESHMDVVLKDGCAHVTETVQCMRTAITDSMEMSDNSTVVVGSQVKE